MQRFSADADARVTVEADWALVGGSGQGQQHHAVLTQKAASDKAGDIAVAMSAALGALADRIAAVA